MTSDCIAGHEAVIGLSVLTGLDLIETDGRLAPRHPESIVALRTAAARR